LGEGVPSEGRARRLISSSPFLPVPALLPSSAAARGFGSRVPVVCLVPLADTFNHSPFATST
jgi:hypothetical protein